MILNRARNGLGRYYSIRTFENNAKEGTVSKGHLRGGKVVASHSSATDTTERIVKVAEKTAGIKWVALGQITSASGGSHRIRVKSSGEHVIVLVVRMPLTIQEVTLHTTEPAEKVLWELRKKLHIS